MAFCDLDLFVQPLSAVATSTPQPLLPLLPSEACVCLNLPREPFALFAFHMFALPGVLCPAFSSQLLISIVLLAIELYRVDD